MIYSSETLSIVQMHLEDPRDPLFHEHSPPLDSGSFQPFYEELVPSQEETEPLNGLNQVQEQSSSAQQAPQPQQESKEEQVSSLRENEEDLFPPPQSPDNQKNILSSIQDKLDDKQDATYGNDQVCKKIIRKVAQHYSNEFHRACEDENTAEGGEIQLHQFLANKGYMDKVTDHYEMKILKTVLFPLRLKRQDEVFGKKENRGQKSRNEFMNKGTKKAALQFFRFQSTRFLFWGDFELGVRNSADLLEKKGKMSHGKLRNLLERLKKKLVRTLLH